MLLGIKLCVEIPAWKGHDSAVERGRGASLFLFNVPTASIWTVDYVEAGMDGGSKELVSEVSRRFPSRLQVRGWLSELT